MKAEGLRGGDIGWRNRLKNTTPLSSVCGRTEYHLSAEEIERNRYARKETKGYDNELENEFLLISLSLLSP